MKILVIADVHANIWPLETVMEMEKPYDMVCFAGDLVDYGITPSETIAKLRAEPNLQIVGGNHDYYLAELSHKVDLKMVPRGEFRWVHYNLERMSREEVAYVENLPESVYFQTDGWAYLMQHMLTIKEEDIIQNTTQFEKHWRKYMPSSYWDAPKRRIIFGHSHRQCVHSFGEGIEWINPGSLSYRVDETDEDTRAHYLVIRDGVVELKRIPYDRKPSYDEAMRQLREGRMMHEEIQGFRFFFGDALTRHDRLPNPDGISPENIPEDVFK